MSGFVFSIANFLYRYFYPLYRLVYYWFKHKQDAYEIKLLKKFIKPGNQVLDIGANVGFYTELISSLIGDQGKVHAFEPDPVNFRHLAKSCRNKKNVQVNNMAVSAEPGELKLYTSNLLNVDHRTYPIDEFGTSFTVKAETIDHYLQGQRVDFIKMDIQGAEFYALQGMKGTLEQNRNVILLTEFWPFGLQQAGCSVNSFEQFLTGCGFIFYLVMDDTLTRLPSLEEFTHKPEKEYFNLLVTRNPI